MTALTTREWQVAGGSPTAHLVETGQVKKKSGPRALCGRYPQRNYFPWFALNADEPGVLDALRTYNCRLCPDCQEKDRALAAALTERGAQ